MKKHFNYILIFIVSSFVFISNVQADLGCNYDSKTNVTETSMADPAEFNAYMPLCKMTYSHKEPITSGPGADGVSQSSLKDVARTGEAWTTAYQASVDGKASFPVSVQVCNDPKATLSATMKCEYIEIWDPVYHCFEYEDYWYPVTDQDCLRKCEQENESKPTKNTNKTTYDKAADVLITNPNIKKVAAVKDCSIECTSLQKGQKCINETYEWCGGSASGGTYYDWFGRGKKCGRTSETTVSKDDLPLNTKGFRVGEAKSLCEAKFSYHTTCACFHETTVYTFQCPVYTCQRVPTLVDLCTPSFTSSNGNKVYCVNPGQPFSPDASSVEGYIKDSEFNVRDCVTSYSTVGCGYANILIESAYYNNKVRGSIDDKTIEFALRLWSVHTQQAGFNTTGVSNRINSSCSGNVFFMRGDSNEVVNPYVKSYAEFRGELLEKVRYREKINPVSDVSLFELTCDSRKLGIACGNSVQYKQAFALLASTILGNGDMQQHLTELFEGEINEDISDVNLISDETSNQYIEIHFDEITNITKQSNAKIDCKKLNNLADSVKRQIEPYCNVSAKFVDGNGRELGDLGGGTPDYCYKDYCRVKVEKFAMCDVEEKEVTPIKIEITHIKSHSSESVDQYYSCANPNANQLMVGFDADLLHNVQRETGPGSSNQDTITETYIISNYRCAGKCDDLSLRGEIKASCDDDPNNYDKAFTSSVKDPSLKCIVNMDLGNKTMYDYSSYFGVNTQVCKIFCSDEINIHIADKKRVTSGTKFYYDIESSVNKSKNIRYLFTDIVEMKRNCVSEIYYNVAFPEPTNWRKNYKFGSEGDGITSLEIDNINNWPSLFRVMVKKAIHEGEREENVNKLLFDLMNCNLYSKEQILATGVKDIDDKGSLTVRDKVFELFSESNKYGISPNDECVVNKNKNDCVKMSNINYAFGSGADGKIVSMKSVASVRNNFDNLVYCSGYNCFAYDSEHKEKEYDYPTNTVSSTETIDIKSSDDRIMHFYDQTSITIPTNDYVMFEITANVSFYNASRYETKPNGEVIYAGTNTSNEQYMSLPPYTYTVSKDAYNLPACASRNFLSNDYHRCAIEHTFTKIGTFFRREIDDQFTKKVSTIEKFGCFVDVRRPVPPPPEKGKPVSLRESTIFRNVDVSNMFPSSSDGYSRNTDSNWATPNGRAVTDLITNSADELKTTDKYLDYRIVINPVQIKNIKEYNKGNGSYMNEQEINCQIVGDTYQKCASPFMNELRNSTEYGTIDPEHSTLK